MRAAPSALASLTEREQEVLGRIAREDDARDRGNPLRVAARRSRAFPSLPRGA
jgi:hypothetical protein